MSNDFHYGVAVGINRYPEFEDLHNAKRDAEQFSIWLKDSDGGDLPEHNVKLVVVPDSEMPDGTLRESATPTHANVLDEIKAIIRAVEAHVEDHPEDWMHTRLYLFVSGHGIAPEPGDAALLTANAGPDDLGYNIPSRELIRYLSDSRTFKEIVIFADCCRDRLQESPPPWIPWAKRKNDRGEISMFFGCAADSGEQAFEPTAIGATAPDDYRGYFTTALLEGLNGAAAAENESEIDSNNLARFLREKVIELTQGTSISQKANTETDPSLPILFRTAVHPSFQIQLVFSTGFQGTAVLRNGNLKEIDRKDVADGIWIVHLPYGGYLVEDESGLASFDGGGFFKVLGGAKTIHV